MQALEVPLVLRVRRFDRRWGWSVHAPVLRAPPEPDAIPTVLPPLPCSTFLLQALEVVSRLEQVRLLPCCPPLC